MVWVLLVLNKINGYNLVTRAWKIQKGIEELNIYMDLHNYNIGIL